MRGNRIVDSSVLWGLSNLNLLNLAENEILDIGALSQLIGLTELYLRGNQITDITVLSNLTDLKQLDLAENQIVSIGALSRLSGLTGLYLGANNVIDINVLSNLNNLKLLDLAENQISDIKALVDNSGLEEGDYLDVRYNFLDLAPGSEDMLGIEALQGKGVDALFSPQN